jgi:hypothetical protein
MNNMNNLNLDSQENKNEGFVDGEIISQLEPKRKPHNPNPPPFNPRDMANLAGLSTEEGQLRVAERAEEVSQSKTVLPVYKQSLFKIVTIGGCLSIACFALGFLVFGGGQPTETVTATETDKPADSEPPEKLKEDFKPDPRFGVVNSKLAMQKQQQDIIAAAIAQQTAAQSSQEPKAATATTPPTTQVAATATAASTTPKPEVATAPPTNVEPPITPAPVAIAPAIIPQPPQPRTITRTIYVTRPAAATRPAQVRIARPKPYLVASSSPVTPPRPVKLAAKSIPQPIKPTIAPKAPQVALKPVSWQQATAAGVMVWNAGSSEPATAAAPVPTPPPAETAPVPATTQVAQIPQIADRSRTIIPGQIRSVSLITPLQILAGEPAQEILLNLEQGFVDMQGGISLPANTKVLAQVTVANNGLIRISGATALVGDREYQIPPGALMISASDNAPPLAQLKQFGTDEVGRRDMQAFLMGAAQGIGEVLTQPKSTTQAIGIGGSVSTTENDQNILGGVLKGGATPIVQQWLQRNQAEVQRLNGATRLWHLPAGHKLSLYAVRKIELR